MDGMPGALVTLTLLLWMSSFLQETSQVEVSAVGKINPTLKAAKKLRVPGQQKRGVHIVDPSAVKRQKARKRVAVVCPASCTCTGGGRGKTPDVIACRNIKPMTFPWDLHKNTTQLWINGGDLDRLSPNMFKGLSRLTRLSIMGCKVNSIMEQALYNLTSLEYLNLARNNFTSIENNFNLDAKGLFPPLALNNSRKLVQLDLSSNKIENPISQGAFRNLKYLKHLQLSDNQLRSLDSEFSNLWGIQILEVQRNQLSYVSTQSLNMALKLRELDLSKNFLTVVSKLVFRNLIELTTLDLSENQLVMLENGTLSNLVSLEKLFLQRNQLIMVENTTFRHSNHVKLVDLSSNYISIIEDNTFALVSKLETLLLNRNLLEAVGRLAFSGTNNLKTLQLSDNRIRTIQPKAFDDMTNLKYLKLDNNQLTWLSPYLFDAMLTVRSISIRNNKLSLVDSRWFLPPILALEDQELLTKFKNQPLPATVGATALYRNIDNVLAEYDFSGNRWRCDCAANQFLLWLQSQTVIPLKRFDTIRCDQPFYRKGQFMSVQNPNEQFCRYFYNQRILLAFVLVIAGCCAMVYFLHFKARKRKFYKLESKYL